MNDVTDAAFRAFVDCDSLCVDRIRGHDDARARGVQLDAAGNYAEAHRGLEETESAFEAMVKSMVAEQKRVFSEKMKEVEKREVAFDAKVKVHEQQLQENAASVAS